MKPWHAGALVLAALASQPAAAQDADGLEACVVAAATEADRRVLVRWMFSAMSMHGELRDLATVLQEQRDQAGAAKGAMMERMLTRDCEPQARQAFRDGRGEVAFQQAFKRVGEIAGEGLFQDQAVAAEAAGIVRHLDMNRIVQLFLP